MIFDVKTLIGLTEKEAKVLTDKEDYELSPEVTNAQYKAKRIQIKVENDKIISARIG